jgi:cation diffusion facilitator family transporter
MDEHVLNKKAGRRTIWASVLLGVLLIATKLTLGILGRSQALVADAIHSVTDFITDVFAFFGLMYAFKAEDRDHPFGHGKIDTLMSLLIGIAMLLAGLWLGFDAARTAFGGHATAPTWLALAGAVLSILIKEGLFQYTIRVGSRIDNQSLVANAWHHRSDALSSVAVVLGVIPALINPAWAVFDALAALIVAAMIFKFGLDVVVPAFRSASDAAPSTEKLREIEQVAYSIDGVRNAHDIRARYYSNRLYVEIHIIVDPEITVAAGHEISRAVRHAINTQVSNILDVIVHLDPDDPEHARHFHGEPFMPSRGK